MPGPPVPLSVAQLTDGEWHRLHPATPLLKGGFFLLVVLGWIISTVRERVVAFFVPGQGTGEQNGDPVEFVISHGYLIQALLIVAAVLIVLIAIFYLSWRVHTFRITSESVEVRSGILFRTNRKARLDRIQGINIQRPFVARLFGAARLEISQAGHDANVNLAYLGSAGADDLRLGILRLASGSRQAEVGRAAQTAGKSVVDRRLNEFLSPELDPNAAKPESVVTIHLGRLLGSILLGTGTVVMALFVIGAIVWVSISHDFFVILVAFPSLIGVGSFYVRRFTRSIRYTIAGTPDGVRVGFGLLSTSNETLPPGRIHSIEVSQPLLWRPAGWWQIRVNRASHTSGRGAANQANTTILPVGNVSDVTRVLALMLPDLVGESMNELIRAGMVSRGGDTFTNSPKRAFFIRPLSWRRNGFALAPGMFLLRKGAVWRRLIIVPHARLQSVAVKQGPVVRILSLSSVDLHTVNGPIHATLGAVDPQVAAAFFDRVARIAIVAGQSDTSHRWRTGEVPTAQTIDQPNGVVE